MKGLADPIFYFEAHFGGPLNSCHKLIIEWPIYVWQHGINLQSSSFLEFFNKKKSNWS